MKKIILILAVLFTASYAGTTSCNNAKILVDTNSEILKVTHSKADYEELKKSMIEGGKVCNFPQKMVDRLIKQLDVTVGKAIHNL